MQGVLWRWISLNKKLWKRKNLLLSGPLKANYIRSQIQNWFAPLMRGINQRRTVLSGDNYFPSSFFFHFTHPKRKREWTNIVTERNASASAQLYDTEICRFIEDNFRLILANFQTRSRWNGSRQATIQKSKLMSTPSGKLSSNSCSQCSASFSRSHSFCIFCRAMQLQVTKFNLSSFKTYFRKARENQGCAEPKNFKKNAEWPL